MIFNTEEGRRNPFPLYDKMRRHSPVLAVPEADLWMIFDYESAKRSLHDHETFSSRAAPSGGRPLDWLIFSDPTRHTKLRALVSMAFTPRSVANLEGRIRELSRGLLDQVVGRGEMDLAADFSVQLPILVIAEMLGIPLADRQRFKQWSDVILNLSYAVTGGEAWARSRQEFGAASVEMNDYLAGLLAERRATPKDDLLTRLAVARIEGEQLTQAEILGFFQLLLLAGSETTTNLINNGMLSLMENPDQLERLRADPGLLPSAIEEMLRFRSPVQAVFRATRREVEIHGQRIPAGKLVLVVVGSANRDPGMFGDPDRFDISREPNPHLAFGVGIHFCIGAPLARLEARIAFSDLLERLKGFRRASDAPWPPRQGLHVHGPSSLPIRFEPRSP